jgi:hypothetical protein
MTDPIRIPVVHEFTTATGDYQQISGYLHITPDIARQIVAISGLPVWQESHQHALGETTKRVEALERANIGELTKEITEALATPPADDAAAIGGLYNAIRNVAEGGNTMEPIDNIARGVLAAIRRDEVPEIMHASVYDSMVDRMSDQITALRAENERLTRERDDLKDSVSALRCHLGNKGPCGLEDLRFEAAVEAGKEIMVERDQLKARVADLEAKLESANQAAIRQEDKGRGFAQKCDRLAAELAEVRKSDNQALAIAERQRDESRAELAEAGGLLRPMANGLRQFAANGIHADPAHQSWRIQAEHFAEQTDAFLARVKREVKP